MNFFIGPMSKNIVDTIIEFVNNTKIGVTFIPSRRQIEYNGGYVNNWTTKDFCEYVKVKSNKKIQIERDHGGPGQGSLDDDGIESLKEDCNYMDIIHIDPWKKYPIYNQGLQKTIDLINFCYSQNPNIIYEIGTEEGIRPFSEDELDNLVSDIKKILAPDVFLKIKYLVIQCGTKLLEKENIGTYNETKLQKMLDVCIKYNLIPKEHNGDWITMDVVHSKKNYGLECINIAPEFGEIETNILLKRVGNNIEDYNKLFDICLKSEKWKKWVSDDFIPEQNKDKLIKICGHYVISNIDFIKLKEKYNNIDQEIKDAIYKRLLELNSLFTIRTKCIFCKNKNLKLMYSSEKWSPICYSLFDSNKDSIFIPYNIQYCNNCDILQTKYLGNINHVYKNNHIDNYGLVKHNMHNFFSDFILENNDIVNTIEIGACHDYLSRLLLSKKNNLTVNIIDPSFTGDTKNLVLYSDYAENINIAAINANTIIMSSVFEHFYEPLEILNILEKSKNIKYIYLNHPNLEYALKNKVYINLTVEHTFYLKNNHMNFLFSNHGFTLTRKKYFENHTICYEFTRVENKANDELIEYNSLSLYDIYINSLNNTIKNINNFITQHNGKNIYLWPASMHTIPLFINGLDYKNISGFVDNSPNKIGKIFYGYNLKCFDFKEIIETSSESTCLILGGAENYRKELDLSHFKGSIFII